MPITVIGRPPPPGVHPPVPALVARATPTSGSSLGRGALVVAAIVFLVFGLGSPKTCSAIVLPGETDSALAAVRKCPRAMELLGADPAPSLVGCTTGESQSGCDSGSGSWSMSVTRERARGTLEIGASKHRTRGWVADSVTLEVGDTRVDVIACKPLPPLD